MTKWLRMTAFGALLPVLMMVSFTTLSAQADLAGMWQGKLAVDPKTALTVQFTFGKDAKGAYTAVLNSPDNPAIKNMPATGVSWDGATLKLQVAALSGSYSGTLKDGNLAGQWTQPGGALPLVLSPYQKPVVTKAAASTLNGAWTGKLKVASSEFNVVFRFTTSDKGELGGTFSVPEQGGNDMPLSDIEFADNQLKLRIPQAQGQYTATLANNQFSGKLKIPSPAISPDGVDLELKRGEFKAPVRVLNLSAEAFQALRGKWQGTLELTPPNGQKVTLPLVARFELNASGQYVGFLDSPQQKATNIPITEAALANGKLTFKVDAVKGEYQGTLDGRTLTGEWAQPQAGLRTALVLTRS